MKQRQYSQSALAEKRRHGWRELIREVYDSRELMFSLIKRDLSVRYGKSYFGYLWAVIPQVVTVAIFAALSSYRVLNMGSTDLPYVIHVIWSISLWQLFASCVISSTSSLVNAGSLVTKVNFPKSILVFSTCGQSLFEFGIRLVPIIIVLVFYGYMPSLATLLVPIMVVFVLLLALALGFVLSILNLASRDVGNLLNIVLSFGVFLAPILYPPPREVPFSLVNTFNPFSPLLITTQQLIAGKELTYLFEMSVVAVLSFLILIWSWRLFSLTIPRITERA